MALQEQRDGLRMGRAARTKNLDNQIIHKNTWKFCSQKNDNKMRFLALT